MPTRTSSQSRPAASGEAMDFQGEEAREFLRKCIGQVARQGRKALGLTQEDVAERVGVNAEFYARIERGHSLPSVTTLFRIAEVLGVSADSLLGHADAASQRPPAWQEEPESNPELRRLLGRVRKLPHSQIRLVSMLLKEMKILEKEEP